MECETISACHRSLVKGKGAEYGTCLINNLRTAGVNDNGEAPYNR